MMARSLRWVAGAALLALCTGCPPAATRLPPPAPVTAPAPAPVVAADPAPVTDGDVTVTYANGMRILVKRNTGAELASMQLYIKGGARLRTKQTAGLEQLALQVAVNGGTQTLDKQAFSKRLSAMGSELWASTGNAYSTIGAKSLTGDFAATLQMLSEVFIQPAMPAAEFEVQRAQQLATVKEREVTPDGRLSMLVIKAMFSGHPFEYLSAGTVASVSRFRLDMAQQHLKTLRQTSRLELVVVGDVAAERVQQLAQAYFGSLPRGSYEPPPLPKPKFRAAKTVVAKAALPTSYIEANFIGPSWGEADFAASVLAMRVLSRRLFKEVRTKRNLSYAPAAPYSWRGDITRGALYVTATEPNTTIKVMYDQVRDMQHNPIGDKELRGAKSVFATGHLMHNETTGGQASWLAICDIVGGDWRLSRTFLEQIKGVRAQDIQAFANKYIVNLQTVVLGDPKLVDIELFESL